MFDASFVELVLIAVVALVVLGPERLPGAVRTAGLWIGRLKRSFNNIKRDIEKEIGADEIRRQLRNEEIMSKFGNTKNQFTKTIDSVKSQTEAVKRDLDIKEQFSAVAGLSKGDTKSAPNTAKASTPKESTTNIESTDSVNSDSGKTIETTTSQTPETKPATKSDSDDKPAEQNK